MFELLFRGENNGTGGTDGYAPVAEDEAVKGMGDNQFGTADARRVRLAKLKDAGFAEHLAVAAAVAELRFDYRVPGNLLPRSKQPLPFFRGRLFLLRWPDGGR